jgi:hypothetical protein
MRQDLTCILISAGVYCIHSSVVERKLSKLEVGGSKLFECILHSLNMRPIFKE